MKKISINDLVVFRNKSERAKKTFVEKIKSNKIEPPVERGGDYWASCLSGICNSFMEEDLEVIDEKILEIQEKITDELKKITRDMHQQNIAILNKYKSLDFKRLRPNEKITILKKSSGNPVLTIKGLDIKTKPSHTYIFGNKGEEQIGVIWFIVKKNGYHINEVGMFCEALYKFLQKNYSKKYHLSTKYCVAVDIVNNQIINYSAIEEGTVSSILNKTLEKINRLM